MDSTRLPPNPCLVAIILLIKTQAGIKHIFHYPPEAGVDNVKFKLPLEELGDSSDDSDAIREDDASSHSSLQDDDLYSTGIDRSDHINSYREDADVDESISASPEKKDINSAVWSREKSEKYGFLGLPPGLQHFLCPDSTFHKKRFEMSIDELVFLGWPVFAKRDGIWERKKKARRRKSSGNSFGQMTSTKGGTGEGEPIGKTAVQTGEDLGETSGQETGIEDQEGENHEGKASRANRATEEQEESKDLPQGLGKQVLNMFHVVFVMDPPPLESHYRVKEMYDHVVKKFSRALKWEQTKSNYVLREAEMVREVEGRAKLSGSRASAHEITLRSSLAKAIATLYNSISTNRIAHITLSPNLSMSLQIPVQTSTSVVPTTTSPQTPGLWLTTATTLPLDDELQTGGSQLASHFALLLLSDLSSILGDVNATASPLAGPLAHYLRCSSPTKSFSQISQSSGIPLRDIQFLASHLIYWRRARAIPLLHQRDTYIVSPNADMRRLKSASLSYSKLFPTLPSLPKMLSMLSTTPRPYLTLIPSKDHKAAYIDILAWLMRGGWVTQLRTFAWVRVPPDIKVMVSREMEKEERESLDNQGDEGLSPRMTTNQETGKQDHMEEPENVLKDTYNSASSKKTMSRSSSISSSGTAIPLASTKPANPGHNPSDLGRDLRPQKPSSSSTLILSPLRATPLESRYLSAISTRITETQGIESGKAWDRCVKFLNGGHALEKIATREGWKRKKVEGLIRGWDEMGVLTKVRHW